MKKTLLILTLVLLMLSFALVGCGGPGNEEPEKEECKHTNAEWIVSEEPTCTEEGSRYLWCNECYKELDEEVVPATGHTYTDNECTCGAIQIVDAASLVAFAESLTYNNTYNRDTVTLTADIDLDGATWAIPSGTFEGTFIGNGHTISNFTIQPDSWTQYVGFFGKNSGDISDLTLANVTLRYSMTDAGSYYGILAGYNYGDITNCHVSGTISVSTGGSSAAYDVGGMFGDNDGTMDRCSAAVEITASAYKTKGNSTFNILCGGLVGRLDGDISNSFATGNVSAGATNGARAGGFIGAGEGKLENCYATGNAYASASLGNSIVAAGGFMSGYSNEDGNGYVKNCFATGNATGSYAGGFAAMHSSNAVIENCYFAEEATVSGSLCETGTATALETIKTAAFGTTLTWSSEIWNFQDGAFPTLK